MTNDDGEEPDDDDPVAPPPPPPAPPAPPPVTGARGLPSDILGINAQLVVPVEAEYGPDYWIGAPAPVYEGKGQNRRVAGYIRKWQWIWYGAEGGLEKTYGDLERDHNRLSSSDGIDTRFGRYGFLTLLQSTATGPDPTGDLSGLHWQNLFDTLMMFSGSGVNVSAITETSATDPTPLARTYSPGAPITCFTTAVLGGVGSALRGIIGRNGAAAQVTSTASLTIDGTMHANTASMWWGFQTILLNRPFIFQAGTSVYSLLQTAALGDAPTSLNLSLPAGGTGLALLKRGSGPQRIYIMIPKSSNATGALTFGAERAMKVIHLSQEGADPQEMGPDDFLGITDVYDGIAWENGVVVTDRKRIVFNNDDTKEEFGWTRDREPDSDREYRVRGFIAKGPELLILVNQIASPNAPAGTNTRVWLESFDHRTRSFHRIGKSVTLSTTGELGIRGAGGLPWSLATGFVHFYTDGNWYRKFEAPYSINPYTYYRQTGGAAVTSGQQFAANAGSPSIAGTLKTPKFALRGCQGWPMVISSIARIGDNLGGGAGAQVIYRVGGVVATFNDESAAANVLADQSQRKNFEDNPASFYLLQLQVDLVRGTSAYMTPNAPLCLIEGYAFLGVSPRAPKFIDDEALGITPGPFSETYMGGFGGWG